MKLNQVAVPIGMLAAISTGYVAAAGTATAQTDSPDIQPPAALFEYGPAPTHAIATYPDLALQVRDAVDQGVRNAGIVVQTVQAITAQLAGKPPVMKFAQSDEIR